MTLPRTGSDFIGHIYQNHRDISIHAPRTGSDPARLRHCTPSTDISTHAPRTGSDSGSLASSFGMPISIHAPRTGSDAPPGFQRPFKVISIHAPRTGSDVGYRVRTAGAGNFNPRSPHGERPTMLSRQTSTATFQSTLPARGATIFRTRIRGSASNFNPRSLHGERRGERGAVQLLQDFNPRSLHGERLRCKPAFSRIGVFQSTLPARERPSLAPAPSPASRNFNPRSLHGERRRSERFQPVR